MTPPSYEFWTFGYSVRFYDIQLRATNNKIFQKTLSVPVLFNLEGTQSTNKPQFVYQTSRKSSETAFLACFFFLNFFDAKNFEKKINWPVAESSPSSLLHDKSDHAHSS